MTRASPAVWSTGPPRSSAANWGSPARPLTSGGFQVQPKRWAVERTFSWMNARRRLARDYETSRPGRRP
ncbi:transposase [Streptomyces oryzae]|uniref:Transposase n=1 Tax=Streptomyces oryzae TaxID=1434886 RepID=A0ABS3X539_9ACTN|nr:transposase [Streptomyces oryzae]